MCLRTRLPAPRSLLHEALETWVRPSGPESNAFARHSSCSASSTSSSPSRRSMWWHVDLPSFSLAFLRIFPLEISITDRDLSVSPSIPPRIRTFPQRSRLWIEIFGEISMGRQPHPIPPGGETHVIDTEARPSPPSQHETSAIVAKEEGHRRF